MAHVTLSIPDDLEKELRRLASTSGRSLSSVVVDLARRQLRPAAWPEGFGELFGIWEGEFPEPDDPPPDAIDLVVRAGARSRRPRK